MFEEMKIYQNQKYLTLANLVYNPVKIFKDTVDYTRVNYKSLESFNVVCVHHGAFFPEKRAKKDNSLIGYCLFG